MSTVTPHSIDLIYPNEPFVPGGWQVSNWDTGQSSIMTWSPNNVRTSADGGSVEFILSKAPAGSARPIVSGEIQSVDKATTGTWSWTAQTPELVSGSIWGLFTYKADHFKDPWVEFDFEFLGVDAKPVLVDGKTVTLADGTVDMQVYNVRLNIHMMTSDDPSAKYFTLEQVYDHDNDGVVGEPIIIDLRTKLGASFDASSGMHVYDITVTTTGATWTVDGVPILTVTQADMDLVQAGIYDIWNLGEMKQFVNLWAVDTDPAAEKWAGKWTAPTYPLVGKVEALSYKPLDGTQTPPPPPPAATPTEGDDILAGTSGDDVIDGLSGHDTIKGVLGNDTLKGSGGNDTLLGGDGNDTLDGGVGTDRLEGGAGNDTYLLADDVDTVVELAGAGTDEVRSAFTYALGTDVENLTLTGTAAIDGTGNALANQITGNVADNLLTGGGGNDTLKGGAGNDRLDGEAGTDRLEGGAGNDVYVLAASSGDVVVELEGGGTDRVEAGFSTTLAANVENLLLTGTGAISGNGNVLANQMTGNAAANTLNGYDGADTLDGGAGNDVLDGGNHDDVLIGGAGMDTLRGGTGADRFVFVATNDSTPGSARDTVSDFAKGQDKIDVSGIDAIPGMAGSQFALDADGSFSAGEIRQTRSGGTLLLEFNTDSDAEAEMAIALRGVSTALTATDFIL